MARIQDDWASEVSHVLNADVIIKSNQGGTYTLFLPCSLESSSREWTIPAKLPPKVIRKKLLQKGWCVGKHLTCPSCKATRPNAHKKVRGLHTEISSPVPVSPPPIAKVNTLEELGQLFSQELAQKREEELKVLTPPAPIKPEPTEVPSAPAPNVIFLDPKKPDPAPEEKLKVSRGRKKNTPKLTKEERAMVLLDKFFLPKQGVFKSAEDGPYSDARIAQEAGVADEQVVALRRRWFGELKTSPELEALQLRVAKVDADLESYRAEYEQIVESLNSEREELMGKIQKLSEENGWSA